MTEELLFRLLAFGVFLSFAENKYSPPVIDRTIERSNDFGISFENTKQEELVTIKMNRLRSIITEIPLRLFENDESLRIALGGTFYWWLAALSIHCYWNTGLENNLGTAFFSHSGWTVASLIEVRIKGKAYSWSLPLH